MFQARIFKVQKFSDSLVPIKSVIWKGVWWNISFLFLIFTIMYIFPMNKIWCWIWGAMYVYVNRMIRITNPRDLTTENPIIESVSFPYFCNTHMLAFSICLHRSIFSKFKNWIQCMNIVQPSNKLSRHLLALPIWCEHEDNASKYI